MKIFKNMIIFIMAIFFIFSMGGCLDFAQNKNSFEQTPLRTNHDGGEKITIVMRGVSPQDAEKIVKEILKREGINNE